MLGESLGEIIMGPRTTFLKGWPVIALALAMPAAATDFEAMVAAERAFAADASARSTRDAFLGALAEDGVVFAEGPTNGKAVWEARKVDKNRLEWTPEIAEIASSGDLGYTSGPWRFTPEGAEKPVATGHFLTVWKKQADGKWKALVDLGIEHPATAFPASVERRGGLGVGPPPTWPVGLFELRSADLAPAGQLDSRMVSADFLRYRQGQVPDGRSEGSALPGNALRLTQGLAISGGGDLAATWGGGKGSASWLRIWRRPSAEDAPGRGWKLAVDLALAAPAAPAASP